MVFQTQTYALQPVVDSANLIQNIEQTLRTIRIEHQNITAIAQRAEQIGQKAQMIVNLQNQLMIAKMNLENIKIIIQEGRYKSISELNALCFQIQRIGFIVTNIDTSFRQLFPELFTSKAFELEKTLIQEKEIGDIAKGTMTIESETIESLKSDGANIKAILSKAQTAPGLKGAIQANTELLAEMASQNMEMKKMLAMMSRVNSVQAAKKISDDKKKRQEHTRFMSPISSEGSGFLTKTLQRITKILSFGYTALIPDAMHLLRYFIILEIFFFGVLVMFSKSNLSHEGIKKFLAIGFYVWLVPNIGLVANLIMSTFIQVGVIAGGNSIDAKDLFDPSAILNQGFSICMPLFDAAGKWANIFDMFILAITGIIILCALFYVAWTMFMTIIEFYLITVIAVWTTPFALFKQLSFIAERSIAGAFAMGIRFTVNALVLCAGKLILNDMVNDFSKTMAAQKPVGAIDSALYATAEIMNIATLDIKINQCIEMILTVVTIAVLFYGANKLASSFFGGAPTLGGSAIAAAVRTATNAAQGAGKAVSGSVAGIIAATSKNEGNSYA